VKRSVTGTWRRPQTPKRMAETIRRLEADVLGRPHCIGKQHCLLRTRQPVRLADHHDAYAADKSGTLDVLPREFGQSVRSMLDQMGGGAPSAESPRVAAGGPRGR